VFVASAGRAKTSEKAAPSARPLIDFRDIIEPFLMHVSRQNFRRISATVRNRYAAINSLGREHPACHTANTAVLCWRKSLLKGLKPYAAIGHTDTAGELLSVSSQYL
jgi:hypothetical protein